MKWKSVCLPAILAIGCGLAPLAGWSQQYAKADRRLAESMLRDADADVQKHYYDSKFHGIDWQARVQEARKNIATARSMDDAVSEIAALLDTCTIHILLSFLRLARKSTIMASKWR